MVLLLFRLLYRNRFWEGCLDQQSSAFCRAQRLHSSVWYRMRWFRAALLARVCCIVCAATAGPIHAAAYASCGPVVFNGEVRAGQAFQHAISPALEFKLEAVPAGWIIRVLPHHDVDGTHDFAELANPPYRSPTPILISTDYAFRAQDAIAWNPRTFRFFTTLAQRNIAESAYQATLRDPAHPAAGQALFQVLPHAGEGEFWIVDAEIAGGTADQTPGAAAVAAHLDQTAHHVRTDLPPSGQGRILALRFRVRVSLKDTSSCVRNNLPQHPSLP